jgi:hypothetical protein
MLLIDVGIAIVIYNAYGPDIAGPALIVIGVLGNVIQTWFDLKNSSTNT